ncbi:MAG: hemerythrin domain-containing protein [Pirellulaceae bacterium]
MTTKVSRLERLDPFVREHECLHQSLDELRRLFEERQSPGKVAPALAQFAEHVQAHFIHEEEEEGFFDTVTDQAPRLKMRSDVLIEEHVAMARELAKLQRHTTDGVVAADWWSRLSDEFESFWQSFCRHERAENELVLEAFDDDIGAEG